MALLGGGPEQTRVIQGDAVEQISTCGGAAVDEAAWLYGQLVEHLGELPGQVSADEQCALLVHGGAVMLWSGHAAGADLLLAAREAYGARCVEPLTHVVADLSVSQVLVQARPPASPGAVTLPADGARWWVDGLPVDSVGAGLPLHPGLHRVERATIEGFSTGLVVVQSGQNHHPQVVGSALTFTTMAWTPSSVLPDIVVTDTGQTQVMVGLGVTATATFDALLARGPALDHMFAGPEVSAAFAYSGRRITPTAYGSVAGLSTVSRGIFTDPAQTTHHVIRGVMGASLALPRQTSPVIDLSVGGVPSLWWQGSLSAGVRVGRSLVWEATVSATQYRSSGYVFWGLAPRVIVWWAP